MNIIAHRGLRHEYPENTLAALEAALQLPGLDGVEFDCELTADGQLVVLHQETMALNSSGLAIEPASRNFTSRDWVAQKTAKEITALDAGSWMGKEFSLQRVPTLEQVLALDWKEKTAFLELKDASFWGTRDVSRPAKILQAARPFLASFPHAMQIISFNPEILKLIHKEFPQIPKILALWTEWAGRHKEAIVLAQSCCSAALGLPDTLCLQEPHWIAEAHEHGLELHVYPVSPTRGEEEFSRWTAESQQAQWQALSQMGADALVSDFARETLKFFCVK